MAEFDKDTNVRSNEYINKAELMNERPEWLNTNMWNKEKSAHNNGWNDCNDEWINTITEMPTIDIVHCYKCKHYEKYTEHTGLCNHFVVNGERLAMEYDWFCADGERRTE